MDDRVDSESENPLLVFVKLTQRHGYGEEPSIRAFYPTDYDQQQLNTIKKYCFPFDDKSGTRGMPQKETFTFIITRENGKYNFGYCLIENDFSQNSSTVYCILSPLPWRKQFYDILRYISHITTADPNTARISAKILHLLKSSKIPTFTMPLVLVANRIELKPPVNWNISSLPSPPSMAMMILRSTLTPKLLVEVWLSLLWERQVILKSKSLATLTDITAAIEELLYPFKWQSIYIIPMPGEMIDYCQAPTPYLIGVHSSLYQTLIEDVGQNMIEDGICILDIDNQAFYSNFKSKDIELVPKRIFKELEDNVKEAFISQSDIKEAFLLAQARLLENYRSGLYEKPENGGVDFNREKYVNAHEDPAHRKFAEHIIAVQMFEQFTQTKCNEINKKAAASPTDRFDLKLKLMPEMRSKMADVTKMAKSGQVLFNKFKDKIGDMNQVQNKRFAQPLPVKHAGTMPVNRSTGSNLKVERPKSVYKATLLFEDEIKNTPERPPPPRQAQNAPPRPSQPPPPKPTGSFTPNSYQPVQNVNQPFDIFEPVRPSQPQPKPPAPRQIDTLINLYDPLYDLSISSSSSNSSNSKPNSSNPLAEFDPYS